MHVRSRSRRRGSAAALALIALVMAGCSTAASPAASGGAPVKAGPGDLVRMPQDVPHGIFNRSGKDATCLFWVSPTANLWDLFVAIDNVPDPAEVVRLAALHQVDFLPPPSA